MIEGMADGVIDDLVIANRILFQHKIVDAFGHISVRHSKDPTKYVLARHMAPDLVTAADLVLFDLNSVPVEPSDHRFYSERYIHGEIYKRRPDVNSVIHCHASPLIPFGVTKTKLKPIYHMSAFLGDGPSTFEIREKSGFTSMLVRTPEIGAALAEDLGAQPMILMRGHGATFVGRTIQESVYRSIYATENAAIELEALRLGDIEFLAPEESALYASYSSEVMHRPWDLWKRDALESRH